MERETRHSCVPSTHLKICTWKADIQPISPASSMAMRHHSLVACSSPNGLRPRSTEPGRWALSAPRRSSASSTTDPKEGTLMPFLRPGGSENGPWSPSPGGDFGAVGLACELDFDDDDTRDVDETLASDLAAMSTFFRPLPSLTTCARPCVAVLALFRYVELTLNSLAVLSGRAGPPNLPKSIEGTGGVPGALAPADLTLTTVGFARMPVWAGVWT